MQDGVVDPNGWKKERGRDRKEEEKESKRRGKNESTSLLITGGHACRDGNDNQLGVHSRARQRAISEKNYTAKNITARNQGQGLIITALPLGHGDHDKYNTIFCITPSFLSFNPQSLSTTSVTHGFLMYYRMNKRHSSDCHPMPSSTLKTVPEKILFEGCLQRGHF